MANDKVRDANRDPITGAPGAHPVGTGVGAALGGMAAGAAAGTVAAGPIGTAAGAVAGALVGGLAGKAVAEGIDPTAEDAYWRDAYVREPYYQAGTSYDEYQPAYKFGWESRGQYPDKRFEDVEADLSRGWDTNRGKSKLSWERSKDAVRAAWNRVENAIKR